MQPSFIIFLRIFIMWNLIKSYYLIKLYKKKVNSFLAIIEFREAKNLPDHSNVNFINVWKSLTDTSNILSSFFSANFLIILSNLLNVLARYTSRDNGSSPASLRSLLKLMVGVLLSRFKPHPMLIIRLSDRILEVAITPPSFTWKKEWSFKEYESRIFPVLLFFV